MDLSFLSGTRMCGGKYSKDIEKIKNKDSEHNSVKYRNNIFFDEFMKFESHTEGRIAVLTVFFTTVQSEYRVR